MILHLHSEEEATDLSVWVFDHCDGTIEVTRQLEAWLDQTIQSTRHWPIEVQVPPELVAPLEATIDDWGEVLSAHDEAFNSYMRAA
jgi:hypothetical protein